MSLFWVLCLALVSVECSVRISLSPDKKSVTCDFASSDETGNVLKTLEMITVAKRDDGSAAYKGLASVKPSGTKTYFDGKAEGLVQNEDEAVDSYLRIEYPGLSKDVLGDYVCVAVGLDEGDFLIRVESDVATVSGLDVLDAFNYRGADIFDSSSFYVVTENGMSMKRAEEFCQAIGGYLAEINTEEEYLFINDMLKKALKNRVANMVLTGAFYRNLSAPFEAYTHPSDPIYVGHWAATEPSRWFMNYNWLNLQLKRTQGYNFLMADSADLGDGIGYSMNRALCEVSVEYLFETYPTISPIIP